MLSLVASVAALLLWRNSTGHSGGGEEAASATAMQIDTSNDVVYLTPVARNPEYNYAPQTKSNIIYAIPLEAVGGSNSSSTAFAAPPPEYAVVEDIFHRRGNTSTMQSKSHVYVDDGFYDTHQHDARNGGGGGGGGNAHGVYVEDNFYDAHPQGTRSGGTGNSSGGGAGKSLRASSRLGVNQVYGNVALSSNRSVGKHGAGAGTAAAAVSANPVVPERKITQQRRYANLPDGEPSVDAATGVSSDALPTAETAC